MVSVSSHQASLCAFIHRYTQRHGYAPGYLQIAAGAGFATPEAALAAVKELAGLGMLVCRPRYSQGLCLTAAGLLVAVSHLARTSAA